MHIHTCPLFYDWTHSHSALAPHPHSALDAWQDRIDATIQHCVCVVQSVSHSLFVYFVYIYMYRVRFARPHSAAADLSLAIYLAVEVQSSPDLGVEVPKSDIKVSMVVCSCMWWCISAIGMRFWLGCLRGDCWWRRGCRTGFCRSRSWTICSAVREQIFLRVIFNHFCATRAPLHVFCQIPNSWACDEFHRKYAVHL